MRWIFAAIAVLAGSADAKDCIVPEVVDRRVTDLVSFAECVNARLAALEQENAGLRKDLAKAEAALTRLPGELFNENGRETRSGGESLVRATFTLTARRREGPASLAIDQKALERLCGGGCTVSLVMEGEALRKGEPASAAAVASCLLRYSVQTGGWSQSGGCGNPVAGVDGDGRPQGRSGGEVIASVGETCILADSEAGRELGKTDGLLTADRSRGLYLIAVPAVFPGTEAKFRCELKLAR